MNTTIHLHHSFHILVIAPLNHHKQLNKSTREIHIKMDCLRGPQGRWLKLLSKDRFTFTSNYYLFLLSMLMIRVWLL